jgi:hypothetical protein
MLEGMVEELEASATIVAEAAVGMIHHQLGVVA